MIKVTDKSNCTGCGACYAACPVNAISLKPDEEGFLYPAVDSNSCISCGACEKACPMIKANEGLTRKEQEFTIKYYSGQLFERDELMQVSSGGAFWALTQTMIDKGGAVYGAAQINIDNIVHTRANDIESAKDFRRSKYFQSSSGKSFRQVKDDLESGKRVLYSGTPCQVAGLIGYLNKDCDNLITCEVVCHGVPSKTVFNKYRTELEKKRGKHIIGLVFRDKSKGWSRNCYKIIFEDKSCIIQRSTKNLFHLGYLLGLFYRPSCGSCRFAKLPRTADITLADYWGFAGDISWTKDDVGISLIVVNSSKGELLVKESGKYMKLEITGGQEAVNSCTHLTRHPKHSAVREQFIKDVIERGYDHAAGRFFGKELFAFAIRRIIKSVRKNSR